MINMQRENPCITRIRDVTDGRLLINEARATNKRTSTCRDSLLENVVFLCSQRY